MEKSTLRVDQAAGRSTALAPYADQNTFVAITLRLWQARRFILTAVFVGAVASAILSLVLPKKYQSTARLMPPSTGSSSASALLAGAVPQALQNAGASALGIQSPGAIYLQVLQSRTVADHLIDKFDLRRQYHTTSYLVARLRLAGETEVAEDRKSGVVTIMVTESSPKLAQQLAQGYVDELNDLMVHVDTSAAHRERVFLENRLKEVVNDLNTDSAELGQFTSKNTIVVGDEQSKAVFTAAETLRGQAILAKADLLALKQTYTSDNEHVRVAQAKLDELERELAAMRGTNTTSDTQSNGFPSIREIPLLGVKYAGLYREMLVEEAIYESLTKQYEMAKVEEARDLPTVRVLDQADLPERKSSPKRTLIVLGGTFLSGMLACALVLTMDWWSVSHSPWRLLAGDISADVASTLHSLPGASKARHSRHDKSVAE